MSVPLCAFVVLHSCTLCYSNLSTFFFTKLFLYYLTLCVRFPNNSFIFMTLIQFYLHKHLESQFLVPAEHNFLQISEKLQKKEEAPFFCCLPIKIIFRNVKTLRLKWEKNALQFFFLLFFPLHYCLL